MESKYNTLINSNPELADVIKSIESDYNLGLRKITHEFGNALTLINSSLQIIESSHPEVHDFKYWDSTISDVHYLVSLVSEISYFNNSAKLNLSSIQLCDMLQSIVDSFSAKYNSQHISCKLITNNKIPAISGDFTKLKQVFINLIKNSCEAYSFVSDTTKTDYTETDYHSDKCDQTKILEIKPKEIFIYISSTNEYIKISIKDNACGITKEQLANIFTPLVSYKKNGTGLGLPISKRIIKAHNGTITVNSNPGIGSEFTITLPL